MKAEVVFDFDCTITTRHLFHTIRSGEQYLADLIASKSTEWDDTSKKLTEKILSCENQMIIANFSDAKYKELFEQSFAKDLEGAVDFSKWMMGGDQRLSELTELLSCSANFHISTKGLVSEVKEFLRTCGLLQFFALIDGYDDQIQERVVYQVKKDQYIIKTDFHDKRAFILSLMKRNPNSRIVYLDDDNEYYSFLRQQHVTCVDIGLKESLDAFSTHQMKKLKEMIDFTEKTNKHKITETDEKTNKRKCTDSNENTHHSIHEKTKKCKCPDTDGLK
jgi:hypothetical protein